MKYDININAKRCSCILLLFYFLRSSNCVGRTAAIISGQLRSGNMTWQHPKMRHSGNYGKNDPPTPVQTILRWLFEIIISQKGGVDVFYYVQAHTDHNNSKWDGEPSTYLPSVGDLSVCEPFLNHSLFSNATGNRFFCLVEPEIQLLNPFIVANPAWKYYFVHFLSAREQFLQQLYGMYRSNLASKQFSMSNGLSYQYKIRIRPDVSLIKPFPTFDRLNFTGDGCGKIIIPSKKFMRFCAEDCFNVGCARDMDHLLDRYIDFISLPYPEPNCKWGGESFVEKLMMIRYNVTLESNSDVQMLQIRSQSEEHRYTPVKQTWQPDENLNQWRQLG